MRSFNEIAKEIRLENEKLRRLNEEKQIAINNYLNTVNERDLKDKNTFVEISWYDLKEAIRKYSNDIEVEDWKFDDSSARSNFFESMRNYIKKG